MIQIPPLPIWKSEEERERLPPRLQLQNGTSPLILVYRRLLRPQNSTTTKVAVVAAFLELRCFWRLVGVVWFVSVWFGTDVIWAWDVFKPSCDDHLDPLSTESVFRFSSDLYLLTVLDLLKHLLFLVFEWFVEAKFLSETTSSSGSSVLSFSWGIRLWVWSYKGVE